MSKASTGMLEQGTQRRPLLQTSSPLNPKINRGLTLRLVQQTGAHHFLWHEHSLSVFAIVLQHLKCRLG